MLAVFFSLYFAVFAILKLHSKTYIDNTAVVFILKNMGTSLNYLLNKKCNLIWEW